MSDIVIRSHGLGKKYVIGHKRENTKYIALRDVLADNAYSLWRKTLALARGEPIIPGTETEDMWALRNIDFEVRSGDALGIIGRNGAGKSTLLKILSRITEPTVGRVEIRGRVASLLEVGTGFHPELTGRENIYLNGAILGMTRNEIRRKFDEIVSFAEVERFLDTPVKRYSSGMYVRLAFAVAAHLEPEILVVDEVLAVGDAEFQKKCLGKMGSVANEGRTVLFVSHNMRTILDLCRSAIWIDSGQIRQLGKADEIVPQYLSSASLESTGSWHRPEDMPVLSELGIVSATISQSGVTAVHIVSCGQSFDIEIEYHIRERVRGCSILLRLIDMGGNVIFTSWDTDLNRNLLQGREPGIYRASCSVTGHLLRPGLYAVTLAAHIPGVKLLDFHESVFIFEVSEVGNRFNKERLGVVQPLLEWQVYKV